jgi:hypothetical protein
VGYPIHHRLKNRGSPRWHNLWIQAAGERQGCGDCRLRSVMADRARLFGISLGRTCAATMAIKQFRLYLTQQVETVL